MSNALERFTSQRQTGRIRLPSASSDRFATKRPVYSPITASPFSANSRGPGTSPWINRPPSRIAAEFEPGIPKLSKGTSAVDATVLFAVSGAAIPSGEPFPNSSLNLDQRRASLYDRKEAMVPPAPGITPSTVPMEVPINCGLTRRRRSLAPGNRTRAAALDGRLHAGSPVWRNNSLTAKSPTMTRIGAMPSSSSARPNVKRDTPETGSVPTVATMSPRSPAANPFRIERPARDAITLRPSTPSAKYDIGVNARARFASGRVRSTSINNPINPPITPEYSEMPNASPPSPR